MLEIQVLVWDRYKNVAGLNWLMLFQEYQDRYMTYDLYLTFQIIY